MLKINILMLENFQYSAIFGMDISSNLKFNFLKGEIKFNNVNTTAIAKH